MKWRQVCGGASERRMSHYTHQHLIRRRKFFFFLCGRSRKWLWDPLPGTFQADILETHVPLSVFLAPWKGITNSEFFFPEIQATACCAFVCFFHRLTVSKKKTKKKTAFFCLAEQWTGAWEISRQSKEIISHSVSAAFAVIRFIETKADSVREFCFLFCFVDYQLLMRIWLRSPETSSLRLDTFHSFEVALQKKWLRAARRHCFPSRLPFDRFSSESPRQPLA